MEKFIELVTSSGIRMVMRAEGLAAVRVLERLSFMMALPLTGRMPGLTAMVVIYSPECAPDNPGEKTEREFCAGYFIYRQGDQINLVMSPDYLGTDELARVRFPLMLILMLGTVNKLSCVMLHGAMLEDFEGKAIIVIASSGEGKSTTAQRFIAAGGTAHHDDQMLLCWNNDGRKRSFFVHGLPTWSRVFRDGLASETFPFATRREVKNIYVLTRASEREEIVEIPAAVWHGHLLGAFFEHMIWPEAILTAAEKLQLFAGVWEIVRQLDRRFRPLSLAARLDGDLIRTLRNAPNQNIVQEKNEA
ncbi:MAG: hypothetical protein PHV82_16695 [Victivallaceae bacterium]|nr:hypothetical protein [Victivallaceae bacterium]